MQWVDSLSDFCSAMADFSATGLLRRVPYAGEYAHEVRSLIKILNAPREDIALVARKRGLLDLADIPEMHRALSDPDYRALLLRVNQGDLKALYEVAESPITKEIFVCREIHEFVGKLKLSDLLGDIESLQASRAGKAETQTQTSGNLPTPEFKPPRHISTPPEFSGIGRLGKAFGIGTR